ncbi:class F sortase [Streptomyces sp. NPDC056437]|uniref:class F sortase n=1 Tax=Streptomyces sp. NPDC056437 TaxID=3345816 RepID=UPI0036CD205E
MTDKRPDIRSGHRKRTRVLLVTVPALLLTGGLLLAVGVGRQQQAPPGVAVQDPATRSAPPPGPSPGPVTRERVGQVPELPPSEPVRISVPSLKISSSLEDLRLDTKRAMQTPTDPDRAGWYRPGPAPGSEGPAVIAGHVTWNGKPAVFFELATLRAGDRIAVERQDGRTAEFTVDKVAQYPKNRFPTVEVYRNLDHARLRLITCGGDYTAESNHYADNIVVFATLTGSHR